MFRLSLILISWTVLWCSPVSAEDGREFVGVWERTNRAKKLTEVLSVTQDLAGELTVNLRLVVDDREIASYQSEKVQPLAKTQLVTQLKLHGAVEKSKWPGTLPGRLRLIGKQLQLNSSAPIRSGRFSRIAEPGQRLVGEWVAQDANHKYTELWNITRDKDNRFEIYIRYQDGDDAVALSHGEAFELRGDVLVFKTIFDKKPPKWGDNRATLGPIGKKLLQTWTAGKHKGRTTLAKFVKKK
ncbi:MAG: hypothetical protein H8E37_01130 [Planctomycetes bacterium]|nr:hypothetical protein [Planctomycetota bacterium]